MHAMLLLTLNPNEDVMENTMDYMQHLFTVRKLLSVREAFDI